MKAFYLRFVPIVLLLLFLVVLPLTWFQEPGAFLYIHDQNMPLTTQEIVQQLFTWSDRWLGSDNGVTMFQLFPQGFLYLVLYKLGLSLRASEMVIFVILFLLPAIFMYLLLKEILPHKEGENDLKIELASTIGALLYSFNLYLLIIWHDGGFISTIWPYALLPLFIRILWQLGFKKCKRPIYTGVALGLLSFFAGASSMPMLVASVIMGSAFFILLYILVTGRRYVKQLIGVTALGALIALCVNLWWFIPHFNSLITISHLFQNAGDIGLDYLGLSAGLGLLDHMQLQSSWEWGMGWAGRLFYSFSDIYENWTLILLWFSILVFTLTTLLKRKNSFVVIFSVAFLLLSLFLAKGVNKPLGQIFAFLYTHVPFFYMFRTPGTKFAIGIVFGLSILLSLSAYNILTRLKKLKSRLAFSSALSLMIIAYSWPFLTGVAVVEKNQGLMFDRLLNIPDFYFQSAEYINKDTDLCRVAMVPGFGFTMYQWEESEGITGPDLLSKLIKAPPIQRAEHTTAFNYSGLICDTITAGKDFRMLGLSNAKYIIFRGDIPLEHHKATPPDIIKKEIAPFAKNSKIIGPLELYKIDDKYFLPHIYPASDITLVSSDINSLVPLTYTPYIDGYPAIAFTEQQNEDSLLMVIGRRQKAEGGGQEGAEGERLEVGNERLEVRGERSEAVEKTKEHLPTNNQVLFANSNFNDLVIDLAKAESEAKGLRQEAGGERLEDGGGRLEVGGRKQKIQKAILVKLDKRGKGKFKVEGVGIYEVWVKSSQGLEDEGWGLEIEDQMLEVGGMRLKDRGKWIKVGEVELEKGKHRIRVGGKRLEVGGNKIEAEKLKKLLQDMEIVIVSKEKLEEYRNIISQKDIGYIFYVDKEKVENMLKNKGKLEDIKLRGNNPFRIGKQEFCIVQDGNYLIKAMMKPKRVFLLKDFVGSNINIIKASLEAISGWDIEALNCRYKQNISEDGMHIDAYFHRRGDIKESIILSKKFSNINIKEKPYLAFSCEMNDVDVQEIELDIMTSDPSNKKVKKITLRADNKQYIINLYEKAKKAIGKRQEARGEKIDLFVNEVVLRFKKKDGVDVSDERKRQIYPFIFKNIAFLKTPPILVTFEDKLSQYLQYLPETYYYFNRNGEIKSADFPDQIPSDIKDVYKLVIQRFIDLKETPVLSLNFPKPVWGAGGWRLEAEGRDVFPSEWKVVLGLDFNGDEKEDDSMEMFVPAAGLIDGEFLLSVRAYKEAKKKFPDKQNYNLLFIGISHLEDKEMLYQTVMSKKLIRYREHIYKPSELKIGNSVLEVDGNTYRLAKGEGQRAKGNDENNWIEFVNINLKKGEHSLNVLENDKFRVEMVEIKPEIRGKRLEVGGGGSGGRRGKGLDAKDQIPAIEFKKVNPTRYVVDVKGAKGPFTLVFSESFHDKWKAYIRKRLEVRGERLEARDERLEGKDERLFQTSNLKPQTFSKEPWSALRSAWKDRGKRIEIKGHFVVNGYANGWIVPINQMLEVRGQRLEGEKIPEDFQIVVEFKPQRLFEVGLLVSAITLLGCIGYLGFDWYRRKRI